MPIPNPNPANGVDTIVTGEVAPDPNGTSNPANSNGGTNPKKRGRTKKGKNKIPTQVYLSPNLSAALDRYCDISGQSKSGVMASALYDYLRKYQGDGQL